MWCCPVAGLEVPGLAETLGLLLDMAVAVHRRCAASTAAVLDIIDKGERTPALARSMLSSLPALYVWAVIISSKPCAAHLAACVHARRSTASGQIRKHCFLRGPSVRPFQAT